MNHINKSAHTREKTGMSFEFFPPRNASMERRFWRTVGRLEALGPDFFSVTYGALGSGREQSLNTVRELCAESSVPVAAHLTCVDASRTELNATVDELLSGGISGVVALRGDSADPEQPYKAAVDGYESVPELVSCLRSKTSLAISVAAYPEVHPQAKSPDADLQHLKNKLDAGADQAITQYFFDAADFLRFRDRASRIGINKPIIPGILPIHNYERLVVFSRRCGASVPAQFAGDYEKLKDDPEGTYKLSVELAVTLCDDLRAEGIEQFHFYTLNQTDLSYAVCCELLSVHPEKNGDRNFAA